MLRDLNPTTRCYPRTMTDAFKDDIENSKWFYPPEKNHSLMNVVTAGIGLCMWVGIAYLFVKN